MNKILTWHTYVKLSKSVEFKNYGNNLTKDRNKCGWSSFLLGSS